MACVSPQDIRLLGQTQHGVYNQAGAVDPALLHHYYGVGGSRADDTGDDKAGPASDEDRRSQRDIADVIADAQSHNVRHEAAEVAGNLSPFESNDDQYAFALALGTALDSAAHPVGFHLNKEYESFESYRTGRSAKPLVIPLPHDVWFPRIVVWCKALDLLKRLTLCKAMIT